MSTQNTEEELRAIITELLKIVRAYVAQLEQVDPGSKEGARIADSVAKLLRRVKDFENRLSAEEQDVVLQLSKIRKTTVKVDESDRIQAAIEYLNLALHELKGEIA